VAIFVPGCVTTSQDAVREGRAVSQPLATNVACDGRPASIEPVLARMQSPPAEPVSASAMPTALPPLPEAAIPLSSTDPAPAPVDRRASPAGDPPPTALAARPPRSGRVRAAAPAGPSGLSSIARNRGIGSAMPEESPELAFPDLGMDPARIYHDRFGVEEDHDPFVFPWLMNLIFEDRWLLADQDPAVALRNQLRHRMYVNIRDPDPDTANFPNGAYTIPKGRVYIENSPVGLYGASKVTPRIYQWEFLVRYGLTDNLEFRIFSNGLTAQASDGKQPGTTGFSPLAFDFKANFWEENTKYHLPAMGVEIYLQSTFGSPAFNGGTQPSINLLFDQTLPFEINFEYNVGITGVQNAERQIDYEFSFQWSFQRQVVPDFDVFVQGFYNAAALPRLLRFDRPEAEGGLPTVNVVGAGAIWTVNDRLAIFGSYNFGTTTGSPQTIALLGFAVAL
jgi:hypothetical protein